MFSFHPIHFLKFLVKSQPQRSYKKVLIKKECNRTLKIGRRPNLHAGPDSGTTIFLKAAEDQEWITHQL